VTCVSPRETEEEVHADGPPAVAGNRQALKGSLSVCSWLHPLADVARPDVLSNPLVHLGPPKFGTQETVRLLAAQVASATRVVHTMREHVAHVCIIRDHNTRPFTSLDLVVQQSIA
jgi:hypothetical protein